MAQVKASEAAESQSQANVNQAKLDLSHTIIDTPIDGVVISRNVDVGQTVAASFQAPVLFVIANDLAQMRVNAAVDEADVGRVREGQEVVFHVDAFPEREFKGTVEQVRLNPTTVSNVVSYNTIVAVDNRDLLLRPGMTATVSIVVRKAENALRLPAAALRFRPEGYQRPTGGAARRPRGAPGQAGSGPRSARGRTGRPGDGPAPAAAAAGRSAGAAMAGRARADRGGRPRTGSPDHRLRAGREGTAEAGRGADRRLRRAVRGGARGPRRGRRSSSPAPRSPAPAPPVPGRVPAASPSTNPFSPQRPQPRQR